MATPLDVGTERRPDGTTVLVAVGELDMSNVAVFGAAIAAAADVGLQNLEYLDIERDALLGQCRAGSAPVAGETRAGP